MKYKIGIVEVVTFRHSMVIDAPEGTDMDNLLDTAQKERNMDDVRMSLREHGCEILKYDEDGSGDTEIEIDDMDEVKEEE